MEEKNRIDVSVIIVNYNTLESTKNTINSVIEKTQGLNYEIILVDNASTDGSIEYFSQEEYNRKIIYIVSNNNLGFGKANNLGVDFAKGKYIFFLNSDTILINNAIKILMDFMEDNLDCGISGGNLYSENLEPAHSFRKNITSIYTELSDNFNLISYIRRRKFNRREDFNYTDAPKEVGYIIGADMMIQKSVFQNVGSFCKDIFMYYEDAELSHRVFQKGLKSYSVPTAKIIHLEGKSFSFKEERYRRQIQGKIQHFYKSFGKKEVKKLYILLITSFVLKYFLTFNKKYLQMKKAWKEEINKIL